MQSRDKSEAGNKSRKSRRAPAGLNDLDAQGADRVKGSAKSVVRQATKVVEDMKAAVNTNNQAD